ncbi:hypothetical protein [Prevotella sp.]|uniref:hypothetical protein n=1 Tax=Prevotella sp. TaxID=59823 RepID=UPI0027E24FA0|nr:hypothetical protein [Prevotella sp.]
MTQQEFTQRAGIPVDATEYAAIETVYMNSDLDKDEFCKLWVRMNHKRVNKAKEERIAKEKEEMLKGQLFMIATKPKCNDFTKLADCFYTKKEKKTLERVGIYMEEEINGINHFKSVSTITYEVNKYLKII